MLSIVPFHKKAGKRYSDHYCRDRILHLLRIDERLAIVNPRKRIGNCKMDTIIGNKDKREFLSLVERKGKFTLSEKDPPP